MKILFDTNVLIAAFIARGLCADLLEHCVQHHGLFTSEFILHEFVEKLVDKLNADPDDARQAAELLQTRMTIVNPIPLGVSVVAILMMIMFSPLPSQRSVTA